MVLLIKKIYTFGALKDKKLITLKNIEDEIKIITYSFTDGIFGDVVCTESHTYRNG